MLARFAARKRPRTGFTSGPERQLTAEEARTWLSVPIGDNERADVLSLVRWFRRRYPTPVERLADVRRAYARWQRVQGQWP